MSGFSNIKIRDRIRKSALNYKYTEDYGIIKGLISLIGKCIHYSVVMNCVRYIIFENMQNYSMMIYHLLYTLLKNIQLNSKSMYINLLQVLCLIVLCIT